MAFLEKQQILDIYGETKLNALADDDRDDEADDTLVDSALSRAEEDISSELGLIFPTSNWTTGNVPPLIKFIGADIAMWYLHNQEGVDRENWDAIYETAIKKLERIRMGDLDLNTVRHTTDIPETTTDGDDIIFEERSLKNLKDMEKEEDIAFGPEWEQL